MTEMDAHNLGSAAAARGEPKQPPAELKGDCAVSWIMGFENVELHPELGVHYR